MGVEAFITFHGPLPDAELAPTLRGADIFLMLSERQADGDVEGFGIAILEANHLGLPAIGANDSGITDAIQDGYSGRLVGPHDTTGIADAVEEIMQDYPVYAARAKTWAGGFTWEKVIERYLEVL
ncbi:MAG: glycosyltransferase family 4 protein [Lewinellaceae bacterium]|nr:glycosyltransferase family 4 protein [Lewinellaceae bacterium]